MKITKVTAKVYEWKGKTEPPRAHFSGSPMDILPLERESMASFRFHGWLVVEVETDEGIIGLGNCALAPRIAKEIIDLYLAPLLIGSDPFDTEYLWQKMYRSTIAWGRKGVGMAALSALDIALWDIKGKKCQMPLFKLLGGKTKEKLRCYASKLYANDDLEAFLAEARGYLDQGFTAMKLRIGYGPNDGPEGMRRNIRQIAALRELTGPDVDIMVECYMGWTLEYAKRILPKIAPYDLRWVEEPVIPDDIGGYAELKSMNICPIAGGEHEFTPYGFLDLLTRRAVDVIQYDTNRVGGITAALKVNALAESFQIPVIPHSGMMHNYHVCMATTASPISEFFPVFNVEVGNELFYYIFEGEKVPEKGFISLDDCGPGLGIKLRTDTVDDFNIIV